MNRSTTALFVLLALVGLGCSDDDDHDHFVVVSTSAADLNLDGFADIVVGAPFDDGTGVAGSERGAVFIFLGSNTGPSSAPDLSLFGAEDGGHFGASLAFVGDVNAHGAPDLLVGAPQDDGDGNLSDEGTDRGRAFVFFGGPGMDAVPDVTLTGSEDGAAFGTSVARIADTDHDGFDDWLIGAPLDDGDGNTTDEELDRGRAFFYYGGFTPDAGADLVLTGVENGAHFGAAVESAGDLNHGGAEDLAVGAPLDDDDGNATEDGDDRGRVYVFGGGTALDATPDLVLAGDENGAHFGAAIAPVFDVNRDGIDDLLVGAPEHNAGGGAGADRGRAYLYFGADASPDAIADVTLSGTVDDGSFGAALSRAGDLDGDGARDFVIGAPREHPGGRADAGSVYFFRGGSVVDTAFDLAFDGTEAGARFGASVAAPGDVDGGERDLQIGAPRDDADGNSTDDGDDRGSVFVFSGGSGVLDATPDAIVDGTLDDAQLGSALAN